MKKIVTNLGIMAAAGLMAATITACNGSSDGSYKIGVMRSDATSEESMAFEAYLKDIAEAENFSIEFAYTADAAAEQTEISNFASRGIDGILCITGNDRRNIVSACDEYGIYTVFATSHPLESELPELRTYEHYVGSVGPTNETQFQAGYDMASHYIEEGVTTYGIFGGAINFGDDMHIYRAAGMLAAMCENDNGATYGGQTSMEGIANIIKQDTNVDPNKLNSTKFDIVGYQGTFSWGDTAFVTNINNIFQALKDANGVMLCVGAGDSVTSAAATYDIRVAGVDAITSGYLEYFDSGYDYDCGKFASSIGVSLTMLLRALDGNKLVDDNGQAPYFTKGFWVADSKEGLEELLDLDKPGNYVFGKEVVEHYRNAETTYADFVEWTNSMDVADAIALAKKYNPAYQG